MTRCGTSVDKAAQIIRGGGVVAIPTETTYGLAVDPDCREAVEKVFRLKKRSTEKPLLLLVAERFQLSGLVDSIPTLYEPLIDRYWPGPLTLIFPCRRFCGHPVSGGGAKIGIRMSPHPVALELVRRFGKPITATSANVSGQGAATTCREVAEIFGKGVDYSLDGGVCNAPFFSTVVDLQDDRLKVIRQGMITIDVSPMVKDG